ncbi:hypothetical Protein psc5_03840 [Candidatus Phytoplasma solani]
MWFAINISLLCNKKIILSFLLTIILYKISFIILKMAKK